MFQRMQGYGLTLTAVFLRVLFLWSAVVPASGLPFLTRLEENGTLHDGKRVFVPRGANYIRLNASQGGSGPYDPTNPVYHSTFSPIYFNATEARSLLSRLRGNGYNIVRVFVDVGAPNRNDGVVKGNYLSPKYMENVAVFVDIAASLQIYTVPTLFMFPLYTTRYGCNATATESKSFQFPNDVVFVKGCVKAKEDYARDFVQDLKNRLGGDLSSLAFVSIQNELNINLGVNPFAQGFSYSVEAADGVLYNMSRANERQTMFENCTRYWASSVRAAIKAVSPQTLVGVGMFTYSAVGRAFASSKALPPCTPSAEDCRVPPRPSVLERCVDILDLHVYQAPGLGSLKADLDSSDWESLALNSAAIVMGEFGAWRKNPSVFSNETTAAKAMVHQQVQSCKFSFQGWLFWTADTWEQPRLWNFKSAPKIELDLAPTFRPNPCQAGGK